MISDALQKWTSVILVFVGIVCSQMPMPYPVGPPMGPPMGYMIPAPPPQPVPVPMPVPVPVPIPVPYQETTSSTTTTTTTTTTTEKPSDNNDGGGGDGDGGDGDGDGSNKIPAIAIPIPIPHFLQFAIPAFPPPMCPGGNCPPCPPCSCNPCTPPFFSFCSPCHQKCRCKPGEAPIPMDPRNPPPLPYHGPAFPMPIPMPAPPPVVMVPFPHRFGKPPNKNDEDCEDSVRSRSSSSKETSGGDSCASSEESRSRSRGRGRRNRKRKGSTYDIYRRNLQQVRRNRESGGLVRPVLSYMSRDGDVKLRRRLSHDEASSLIGEGESLQNVQFVAGEDENNRPRVLIMSQPDQNSKRHRKIYLRDGVSEHDLNEGRKELLFRPPENKKISNLSVSFQITR